MLVDRHNYHTFQPLLYQVATDLLEQTAVGHPLRDLFHDQDNVTVHQDVATGIDLAKRRVTFEGMKPTHLRLPRARARRRGQLLRHARAPPSTPSRCTRSPTRCGCARMCSRSWEAADKDPALIEDGALNVVVVGGGATGIESVGAMAELYRNIFSKDYRGIPQEQARLILVEAGPELFTMFKADIRKYTKKDAREARRRGHARRARRRDRADAREAQVGQGAEGAHARVGRRAAGEPDRAVARRRARSAATASPSGPDLSLEGHPEVFATGDIAWINDENTDKILPQLGSVALQSGECAGENIARLVAGKKTEPFDYTDKGTMATIGRGAAVVQFKRGRTHEGQVGLARVGHRPSGAALDRRGPREGRRRLDLGGLLARAAGTGSAWTSTSATRPRRHRRGGRR